MSKFVVGQWVVLVDSYSVLGHVDLVVGKPYKVIVSHEDIVIVDGNAASWSTSRFVPFEWKVGRTYKTTRGDVITTITEVERGTTVSGDTIEDNNVYRWHWCDKTGLLVGLESFSRATHLLPYEVDQPVAPESESKQNGWNQIIGKWPGDESGLVTRRTRKSTSASRRC